MRVPSGDQEGSAPRFVTSLLDEPSTAPSVDRLAVRRRTCVGDSRAVGRPRRRAIRGTCGQWQYLLPGPSALIVPTPRFGKTKARRVPLGDQLKSSQWRLTASARPTRTFAPLARSKTRSLVRRRRIGAAVGKLSPVGRPGDALERAALRPVPAPERSFPRPVPSTAKTPHLPCVAGNYRQRPVLVQRRRGACARVVAGVADRTAAAMRKPEEERDTGDADNEHHGGEALPAASRTPPRLLDQRLDQRDELGSSARGGRGGASTIIR